MGTRHGAHHEIVDGHLRFAIHATRVELRPQRQERIDLWRRPHVEMRDGLLAEGQPGGDGGANLGMRLVGKGSVRRARPPSARRGSACGGTCGSRCSRRRRTVAPRYSGLHIPAHDPAAGAGSGEFRQRDPGGLRHLARYRAGENPSVSGDVARCRTVDRRSNSLRNRPGRGRRGGGERCRRGWDRILRHRRFTCCLTAGRLRDEARDHLRAIARGPDDGERRADRHPFAGRHQPTMQHPVGLRLDFDHGLVGLDHQQHVGLGELGLLVDRPFQEHGLFRTGGRCGHAKQ